MNKFFKSVASYSWGVLLFALLFLAAGICLIAFPGDALETAVLTISIITIVFGVVLILMALLDKKRQAKFFFFLLGGACALFAGIFLLIKRNDGAVLLLALFIGAVMMIDGSFKLHAAVSTKQFKNAVWWILLVLSLLTIAGGLFLIKWPPEDVKACSVMMGIFMILDAIQNVFITFYTPAVERKLKREFLSEAADQANAEKQADETQNAETAASDEPAAEPEKTKNADDDVKTQAAAEPEKTKKKRGFGLFGKRKKAETETSSDASEAEADEAATSDQPEEVVDAEPDVVIPGETDDVIETVVVKDNADENAEN
ncbi:MAG TPA: hypothetical protein DIV38_04390 [Clostridiales bacterium]|nr:hypothetical protein [Clostridiales bacterium]